MLGGLKTPGVLPEYQSTDIGNLSSTINQSPYDVDIA
jgi:hypothetical protein